MMPPRSHNPAVGECFAGVIREQGIAAENVGIAVSFKPLRHIGQRPGKILLIAVDPCPEIAAHFGDPLVDRVVHASVRLLEHAERVTGRGAKVQKFKGLKV